MLLRYNTSRRDSVFLENKSKVELRRNVSNKAINVMRTITDKHYKRHFGIQELK